MKTTKTQFSLDSITNNPTTKKSLEGFIEEIKLHRGEINKAKNSIKDIQTEAKDSLGIPGKILSGLVSELMEPGTIDQHQHELEELSDIAVGLGIKD